MLRGEKALTRSSRLQKPQGGARSAPTQKGRPNRGSHTFQLSLGGWEEEGEGADPERTQPQHPGLALGT